ncbi:DEAD-domain-containing protein [Coemansia reversa NRRL 1564]|uniref:DEAD-domain-containing protein n=1 Tax=Coemansia reversa (strain ATCC 12441 / NRRL 1564) TaxID=763665 RepID=A0A2G5BCQ8_COERN|nr:DEAD-domain-containing protein [Coemansia reversa NRRL 1564]|eukprot:PIA16793.1 DEAD-domain-containing protein [Coemansia reversa NRRL 1564]
MVISQGQKKEQTRVKGIRSEILTELSDNESSSDDYDGDKIEVIPATDKEIYPIPAQCTFRELGLDQWVIDTLVAMSIKQPTEIQRACIRGILKGEDVIGGAKTGSGKTAAFALPILQKLSEDPFGVFAVILTPTRELAFQIAEQFEVLGKGVGVKVTVVIGGVDMVTQAISLGRRPHIIVATPGRLADHIISSTDAMHLGRVKYLVLDEADRLLTDTFAKDLEIIVDAIPKQRQTLLFTATVTSSILALRDKPSITTKKLPFIHICDNGISTVTQLTQQYIFVPSHVKEAYLVHLLTTSVSKLEKRSGNRLEDDDSSSEDDGATVGKDKSIIIFVGHCRVAETLRVMLYELGFRVAALHSKMAQQERLNSLGKFRAEAVRILIATDVGSRGLDIPSVELVVNMHVPRDPDEYIHRVGRTARAGRGGRAVTIMTERDIKLIHNIEARVGCQLTELKLSETRVLEDMGKVLAARRAAALHLLDTDFGARDRVRREKYATTTEPSKRRAKDHPSRPSKINSSKRSK